MGNKILKDNTSLQQEIAETNNLVNSGVAFSVGKREFVIKQPCLGTLDMISAIYLQMEIETVDGEENPTAAANAIVRKSAKLWAQVAAIAVLNNKWRIKLFGKILSRYFLWKLTPSNLKSLSEIIIQVSNTVDFIISIRSIAGVRTARPNPIEQNKLA